MIAGLQQIESLRLGNDAKKRLGSSVDLFYSEISSQLQTVGPFSVTFLEILFSVLQEIDQANNNYIRKFYLPAMFLQLSCFKSSNLKSSGQFCPMLVSTHFLIANA